MAESRMKPGSHGGDYKLKWDTRKEVPYTEPRTVVSIDDRIYIAGRRGVYEYHITTGPRNGWSYHIVVLRSFHWQMSEVASQHLVVSIYRVQVVMLLTASAGMGPQGGG